MLDFIDDPNDQLFFIHFCAAIAHFFYFVIYYSRYSSIHQRLTGLEKMERAGVIAPEVIEASRRKYLGIVSKWKRITFYPNLAIGVLHVVFRFVASNSSLDTNDYVCFFFVTLGGVGLILLANFTKGAQVFDPYKRFRGNRMF